MPLPYSRRLEGLATGLSEAFGQAGVALSLVYMRGALSRLQNMTMEKFDFIIMSRFSFNNALQRELNIQEVLSLGIGSYVSQHIILLANDEKKEIEDGMRVGIDPSSIDQVLLAKKACRGKEVEYVEINYISCHQIHIIEYVEINYMNLMTALKSGQIDVTIWNADDFYASSNTFKAVPLDQTDEDVHLQENTEAVIVTSLSNRFVLQIMRSIIDPELVSSIQKEVLDNQRLPVY